MNKKTTIDYEIADMLIHTRLPFCSRVGYIISEEELKFTRYRIVANSLIELEKSYETIKKELIEYKKRFGEIEYNCENTYVPNVPDDEIFNPYDKGGF